MPYWESSDSQMQLQLPPKPILTEPETRSIEAMKIKKVLEPDYGDRVDHRLQIFRQLVSGSTIAASVITEDSSAYVFMNSKIKHKHRSLMVPLLVMAMFKFIKNQSNFITKSNV